MNKTKKIKKPKAILFDWDNTLIDTWPIMHNALHNTFLDMGKDPWPIEVVKKKVGLSARDTFPQIFGQEHTDKAIAIYRGHYVKASDREYQIYEGARELIELVNNLGIYAAVVSNKNGPMLRKEVEKFNMQHLFAEVIGSMDAERDKPHRDPVDLALSKTDIKPGPDVWFIGDTIIDMQCAYNTGCVPVLFGKADDSFSYYQPHISIDHHNDLAEILKSSE